MAWIERDEGLETLDGSSASRSLPARSFSGIKVTNLAPTVTEIQLIGLFSPFGKIMREELEWSKTSAGEVPKMCFVEFASQAEADAAEKALSGKMLEGMPLDLDRLPFPETEALTLPPSMSNETVNGKEGTLMNMKVDFGASKETALSVKGDFLHFEVTGNNDGTGDSNLIMFLADILRVHPEDIVMVEGRKSRTKKIFVGGVEALFALSRFSGRIFPGGKKSGSKKKKKMKKKDQIKALQEKLKAAKKPSVPKGETRPKANRAGPY